MVGIDKALALEEHGLSTFWSVILLFPFAFSSSSETPVFWGQESDDWQNLAVLWFPGTLQSLKGRPRQPHVIHGQYHAQAQPYSSPRGSKTQGP